MEGQSSLLSRWEDFQPSKTAVAWICAGCVAATIAVGFTWGGWVRGSTAQDLARRAADGARAELAAVICVNRFVNAPDFTAKLASLKKAEQWKRAGLVEDGGWATLPGTKDPVSGAASLCAEQLLDANLAPAKAVGASG